MIRVLVLTTAAGLGVCVLCLSIAMAIGGSGLLEHGWSFPHGVHVDVEGHHRHGDDGGPTTTRELTWDGATSLEVDAPADIRYTQAPGPAKITVTGPAGAVNDLSVSGGSIDYDGPRHGPRLLIVMSAPSVDRFELDGDSQLTVQNYDQDRLKIDIDGHANANVQGKARAIDLTLSGRGDADLSQVAAQEARVDISGSGSAKVAPKASAEIDISGSGEVNLMGHPAIVHSDVSGSGRIIQSD
ncbi:MAG TPA: DUF2807 domain-containing protein, partial [Caulobacteraceae bacterium]